MDFISCRNLLIYLDRELQQQACTTLHYALIPGGFLLLGASETADNPPGLFRNVDRKARIYQSATQPGDKPRLLPQLLAGVRPHGLGPPATPSSALSSAALHRQALEKVAPPSILVDHAQRVVHLSEHAGRYLQPSGGPLSGDAVDLVRQELRFELRAALHRALEQGESTLTMPILISFNGAPHRVYLQVKPTAENGDGRPRTVLVLFIEGDAVEQVLAPAEQPSERNRSADETVRRLTEELQLTQSRLRTTREESEAANEELRAANEELQSINEEYRSTSEELETSKEELQSINEELQTVNSELKLKLDAVSRAHNDLQNLMAATDFGTLFLDSSMGIKRFTERVTDVFSLTPSDEGRPLADFSHQLEYDDLLKDARTVLAHLAPIRREIRSRNGRWYDIRLRLYRTVEDKIDGVVITFVDVTERRHVEEALRNSEQALRQEKRLVDLSGEPIFVWDFDDGTIREWNRGCEELYGFSREEALGRSKENLLTTSVPGSSFAAIKAKLADEGSWDGEFKQRTKDRREVTVESRLQLESVDDRRLVLESTRNVSERKRWEQRQQLLLGELTHRVNNTLALAQSIAHQTMRGSQSIEDFGQRFEARLLALARAHSVLIGSEWKGGDLGTLVRNELAPYASDNPQRFTVEGEAASLPPDLVTSFGLVLHELATNAAKYGALSRVSGTLNVNWQIDQRNNQRLLTIIWREQGGPTAAPPTARGFGSSLIEKGIPNATVNREFLREGMVCTIEFPLPETFDNGLID
jgi:two-component system CheB/CheR fusion protein